MKKSLGTMERVARELARALAPLETEMTGGNVRRLFAALGLDFPEQLESASSFVDALSQVVAKATGLPSLSAQLDVAVDSDEGLEIGLSLTAIGDAVGELLAAVDEVKSQLGALGEADALPGIDGADVAAFAEELPERLLQSLVLGHLDGYFPIFGELLEAGGLAGRSAIEGDFENAKLPHTRRELKLGAIGSLLASPEDHLQALYGWGAADFDGEKLLGALHQLMFRLAVAAVYSPPSSDGEPAELEILPAVIRPNLQSSPRGLDVILSIPLAEGAPIESPFIFDGWKLRAESNAQLEAGGVITLQPGGALSIVPSGASDEAQGDLGLYLVGGPGPGEEELLLFGQSAGSRLTARSIKAGVDARFKWNASAGAGEGTFALRVVAEQGTVVIDSSGADGFLSSILPADGVRFDFDFVAGWSGENGLYLGGGGALETAIPVHASIGPIDLETLYLVLGFDDGEIAPELSIDVGAALGPLEITVSRIGLATRLAFEAGNPGPLDVSSAFKPPSGLGISIDAYGFLGGGFLSFDPDNERYAGMLELEFQGFIELKAIGLLTTKLPDGSDGFSLLIIITAEFTPIQLGFGFTLNGVGGLFGLHRTMQVEVLRTGIRENTLDSILFPSDIIANANKIISDLRQVFPPFPGQFLFGPMGKAGWGTPTLITLDLGLVIEVPDPLRIGLLGVLRALLPDEDFRLLSLQVNFIGVIDTEKGLLSFDASLYDSRLLCLTLAGDMALRLGWGENPNFVLSVGGFHPAYQPPPLGLQKMTRLTINVFGTDNPRLTLEAYFAVTSNSVQFGAKLELYAAAGDFNVYGLLVFDVLFQFSPFYFAAGFAVEVAVRFGTATLFAIALSMSLEGPTPWRARGTAELTILVITFSVDFDVTFGEERDTTLPDAEVMPLLVEALGSPGNWRALVPENSHLQVTVREIIDVDDGDIVAHPFGVLEVSQKVVPLNTRIDKFGNQKPSDGRRFAIESVSSNGDELQTTAVKEYFAPAQFREMEDSDKLTAKSFEKYTSGVRIAASEELQGDYFTQKDVEYEVDYLDSPELLPQFLALDSVSFSTLLKGNAAAKSPLSKKMKNAVSPLAPDKVSVSQEKYAVVGVADLKIVNDQAVAGSETEAHNLMIDLIEGNPALTDQIQVVPYYEAAA